MTTQYNGTYEELQDAVANLGIRGTWAPEPNGVYMLRCPSGANMHWASSSKTVWFDGQHEAVQQLLSQLETKALPGR